MLSPPAPTLEQRSPMYADVRHLLTPGFLTETVRINETALVLRTFNRGDYFMLLNRGVESENPAFLDWIIAAAVWVVDGQPVLEDPSATYHIREMCAGFPRVIKHDLMAVVGHLRERVETALNRVEAFFYEDESRFIWRAHGPRITGATGVPGSERLGVNALQELWIAYNEVEDHRESFVAQWTQTKLIAQTMAPKGIKKLNKSDEMAQRRLDQEREAVRTKAYYQFIGREELAAKRVPEQSNSPYVERYVVRSVEDMQEEYRKWRQGIKDEHDLIVDAYKAKIREKMERERHEREERIVEVDRAMETEGVSEPPLRNVLGRIESMEPGWAKGKRIYSGGKSERLYERYLKNDVVPGAIRMKDGQAISVPDTLQERVEARKPGGK